MIEQLGFIRVTIDRPLRVRYEVSANAVETIEQQAAFRNLTRASKAAKDPEAAIARGAAVQNAVRAGLKSLVGTSTNSHEEFEAWLADAVVTPASVKVPAAVLDAVRKACSVPDAAGDIARTRAGKARPDAQLRDWDNLPLTRDPEEYLDAEVRPWAEDAWIDHSRTIRGYEIPLTNLFYRYRPPRSPHEIDADIRARARMVMAALEELTA